MREVIKALHRHEMRLWRLRAAILIQTWPTPSLEKKAMALLRDIEGAIKKIVTLRETLERIEEEE